MNKENPNWLLDKLLSEVSPEEQEKTDAIMVKWAKYGDLISMYDEYLGFLQKSSRSAVLIATAHGWAATQEEIEKGKQFREKIEELKNNL